MSHLNINGVDKPLDHVYVKARTENLFDWSAATTGYRIQWLTGEPFADANAIMSDFIPVSAGIYRANASFNLVGYDENKTYVGTYDPNTRTFRKEYGSKTTFYGISDSNVAYVKLLSFANTDTLSESTMFNAGSTPLPYEPYLITKEGWEARTRVILHNLTNPLCGIGTYKDTLDLSTGTLTRYIKKLVLDGTEETFKADTGGMHRYLVRTPISYADKYIGLCTHYQYKFGTPSAYGYFHILTDGTGLAFFDDRDISANAFKQWLADQYTAGNPITVWYVLATPTTETITVPSNLTGIVEGYLTQSSTPSPTSPVYPTANGTPEQGGTYSLDTGAYAIAWGRADTFTGTNSMSARCYGLPIKSWEIDGNTKQDGTPSPDNPIMPEFVGEKTINLYDDTSTITLRDIGVRHGMQFSSGTYSVRNDTDNIVYSYISGGSGREVVCNPHSQATVTFAIYDTPCGFFMPYNDASLGGVTIVSGSTPPDHYIPYGFQLPITNAGQTQNVYLGEVQTARRIKKLTFTGMEDWQVSAAWKKTNTSVFFYDKYDMENTVNKTEIYVLSDKFSATSRDGLYNGDSNMIAKTGSYAMTIRVSDSIATTASAFKSWLALNPVTVWYVLATPTTGIVNEPLAKIGTYADTLTSEQAGVTIPTTDGNNTISVDTSLAPSKMTITGHIRDVWFTQSITGVPPLSFKSNGTPLISLSMKGNGQQNGTPAPDNIIMPEFVGDRTINLYNGTTSATNARLSTSGTGTYAVQGYSVSSFIPINPSTNYCTNLSTVSYYCLYNENKGFLAGGVITKTTPAVRTYANAKFIRIDFPTDSLPEVQLSEGTPGQDYEPYGWKIPITSAGQTVPVYLGQTQTVRKIKKLVLTGDENWIYRAGEPSSTFFIEFEGVCFINNYGLCTHYLNQDSGSFNEMADRHVLIRVSRNGTVSYIGIRDSSILGTREQGVTELKTYLSQQYQNGTPVIIWYAPAEPTTGIVNEPLAKIGTYADELIIDPNITPQTGTNTLNVDTTLSPSSVSITGHIKSLS